MNMCFTAAERGAIGTLAFRAELDVWMGIFLIDIVNEKTIYYVTENNVPQIKEAFELLLDKNKTYFDYHLTIDEMVCIENIIKKLGIIHFENKLGLTNERYKQLMEK